MGGRRRRSTTRDGQRATGEGAAIGAREKAHLRESGGSPQRRLRAEKSVKHDCGVGWGSSQRRRTRATADSDKPQNFHLEPCLFGLAGVMSAGANHRPISGRRSTPALHLQRTSSLFSLVSLSTTALACTTISTRCHPPLQIIHSRVALPTSAYRPPHRDRISPAYPLPILF